MGTTTTENGLPTVREFWDRLKARRLGDAELLLHDDLVIRMPPSLPYGGVYHGRAGFRDNLARITALFEPENLRFDYLDATNPVVIRILGRFTAKANGKSAETDLTNLYYVRNGRIAEIDVYYKDPAAISAPVAP